MSEVRRKNLPEIYRTLAGQQKPPFRVERHKYDEFVRLWKQSEEHECIVANCAHWQDANATDGRLLLPTRLCNRARAERAGDAIANTVGELLWTFISLGAVLPVLRIATPIGSITHFLQTHEEWKQACVILHLSSFGSFFIEVEKTPDGKCPTPKWKRARLVGWMEDQHFATFADSPAPEPAWQLAFGRSGIPRKEDRVELPGYLTHNEYLEKHGAEIVAGYVKSPMGDWDCVAVNNCRLDPGEKSLKKLLSIGIVERDFLAAMEPNLLGFRRHLLKHCEDLEQLYACTHFKFEPDDLEEIPTAHRFALVQTYSLVPLEFDADRTVQQIASFFSCIRIDVPRATLGTIVDIVRQRYEKKYDGNPQNAGRLQLTPEQEAEWLDRALRRMVNILWENVDSLKLPITRYLLEEKDDELYLAHSRAVRYAQELQDVSRSLVSATRAVSEAAGKMSRIQGDHASAFMIARHDLGLLFEMGSPAKSGGGRNRIAAHSIEDFHTISHLAEVMLLALDRIRGIPERANLPTGLQLLELVINSLREMEDQPETAELLKWFVPRSDWMDAFYERETLSGTVLVPRLIQHLLRDWTRLRIKHEAFVTIHPIPPEVKPWCERSLAVIQALKRRAHTVFKPAALSWAKLQELKAVQLDDLASFLPADCAFSKPEGESPWIDLFDERSFPFASIGSFLEIVYTLVSRVGDYGDERPSVDCRFPTLTSAHVRITCPAKEKIVDRKHVQQLANDLDVLLCGDRIEMRSFFLGERLTPLFRLMSGVDEREFTRSAIVDSDRGKVRYVWAAKEAAPLHFYFEIGERHVNFGHGPMEAT